MSTIEQHTPHYFCYACNRQVLVYMAPDPTCRLCNDQFVQEIELDSNDPHSNDNAFTELFPGRLFDDGHHQHQREPYAPDVLPDLFHDMMTSIINSQQQQNEQRRRSVMFAETSDDGLYRSSHQGSMDDANNPPIMAGAAVTDEGEPHRPNSFASALFQVLHGLGMPADSFASNVDDYVLSQDALDHIMTQLMEQSNSTNAPPPAPANVIESLPMRKLQQQEFVENADCPVCKDDYVYNEQVLELECAHIFHPGCIKPWLKINGTCPVCRKVVDGAKENERNGSNGGNRSSNFSGGTSSPISALVETTRRLFGQTATTTNTNTNGSSSSSNRPSNTMPGSFSSSDQRGSRQSSRSSYPSTTQRRRRRLDPSTDYMDLDLD